MLYFLSSVVMNYCKSMELHRFNSYFRLVFTRTLLSVLLLVAPPVHSQSGEHEIIQFLSLELGIPAANLVDEYGNLTVITEKALSERPDVVEQAEAMLREFESGESDQVGRMHSADESEAQMILDDYLRWSRENNMDIDPVFVKELVAEGAVVPQHDRRAKIKQPAVTPGSRAVTPVVTDSPESLKNREPLVPTSSVLGVASVLGKLKSKIGISGYSYPVLTGGGVYLVFKDGTTLKDPPPPSDMNLEQYKANNQISVERIENTKIDKGTIMPPHTRGFTLNIYAEHNAPGAAGPTFRGLLLNESSQFKFSQTTMLSSAEIDGLFARSVSSNDMAGTYFIDGNSIEFQYYDGRVERALFATDGKRKVIFGTNVYITPDK